MNDQERWQAQLGLQDAHRTARYFSWLAERNRRWHVSVSIIAMVGTLAASILAGLAFSVHGSTVLSVTALASGLLSASVSVVGIVLNFSARSVRASQLAKEISLTVADWRSLVTSANGNGSESLRRLSKLQKEIEAPVSSELPLNRKLNAKAELAARNAVIKEIHQGREDVETKG